MRRHLQNRPALIELLNLSTRVLSVSDIHRRHVGTPAFEWYSPIRCRRRSCPHDKDNLGLVRVEHGGKKDDAAAFAEPTSPDRTVESINQGPVLNGTVPYAAEGGHARMIKTILDRLLLLQGVSHLRGRNEGR
jgi:hypothetical protein